MIVLAAPYLTAVPGETITIPATGLAPGAVAITLGLQGSQQLATLEIAGTATADVDGDGGATLSFQVPDGAAGAPLSFTDSAGNTGTTTLAVVSQYVNAWEYTNAGEGVDLSDLAPGELDRILRRASQYAEGFIGFPLRLMPNVFEQHTWKGPSERNRPMTRVYLRHWPVVSLDAFQVRVSNTQYATFAPTDIVINNGQRYIEVLSYAVASFTMIGAIENLGLVANIVEVAYTSGFPYSSYPPELKEAVTMIATEILDYRGIQTKGMGGLARVREGQVQYDRRLESFVIPQPAIELLRPLCPPVVR